MLDIRRKFESVFRCGQDIFVLLEFRLIHKHVSSYSCKEQGMAKIAMRLGGQPGKLYCALGVENVDEGINDIQCDETIGTSN